MKRTLAVAAVAGSLGLAGVGGTAIAHAQTNADDSTGSSLVDALAKKFNLDKTKVQAVFDEQRSAMEQQRETELNEEIAQLVKDGKLTQEQADKLKAKRAELQKAREAQRNADDSTSHEERRAAHDQRRTELAAWLRENGIDANYTYLLVSKGGHGHRGDDPRDDRRSPHSQRQQSDAQSSS